VAEQGGGAGWRSRVAEEGGGCRKVIKIGYASELHVYAGEGSAQCVAY